MTWNDWLKDGRIEAHKPAREEIAAQRPHVLDEALGLLNVLTLTVTQFEILGVRRPSREKEVGHGVTGAASSSGNSDGMLWRS